MAVWQPGRTTRETALVDVDQRSVALKAEARRMRLASANDAISAGDALSLLTYLMRQRDAFAAAAALPGMPAFAAEEKRQALSEINAGFSAMLGAINGAIAWIAGALPKAAGGFLAIETMAADGTRTWRLFQPAETAGLRTALAAIEATIGDAA